MRASVVRLVEYPRRDLGSTIPARMYSGAYMAVVDLSFRMDIWWVIWKSNKLEFVAAIRFKPATTKSLASGQWPFFLWFSHILLLHFGFHH